ncbi:MAG: hypothetical protein ACRDWD_14110 [Acidimicrobiia bacterium]
MWRRSVLVLSSLSCAGVLALAVPAGAATPVTTKSAAWLVTRQQPDGGFELAGFPGFETPDAVRAIAEQAQADQSWSASEARAAVLARQSPLGADPLDNLDNFAEAGLAAGPAAKLVALVTNPLGIDATTFDPSCDGTPVNLEAVIDAALDPSGFYAPQAAFNGTLFAALAKDLLDGVVPANTVTYIRNAQRPDGGWNFSGTSGPTDPDSDVDTTALALIALAAAGITVGDGDFDDGLFFLTDGQQLSGAWQAFGSDDPNSTSLAVLGLTAAGFDDSDDEIQDAIAWLDSQQAADGHIISPNDGFGVNTFATSQTIQAILRSNVPAASTFDPVLCWSPDVMVRNKNGTYTEPKVKQAKPAGKTTKFFVQAAHAAGQSDRLLITGAGSADGFTVTYLDDSTDVTADVVAGKFVTAPLDPGDLVELQIKVTIDESIKKATKRTVEVGATSYADPTKRDAVKAVTKVS